MFVERVPRTEIRTNPLHPWTGPVTEVGKAIASMNSLKHGLTARRAVLPGESQADFEDLIGGIRHQYQPATELELQFCDEIAASMWRLQRARAQEAETIHSNGDDIFSGDETACRGFDRILRYVRAIESQINRAISRLEHLQAERRRAVEAAQEAQQARKNAEVAEKTAANEHPHFVSSTPKSRQIPENSNTKSAIFETGMPDFPSVASAEAPGEAA